MTTCERHDNGTTCEGAGHDRVGHTCVTADGVPIAIGLIVRDYDMRLGKVTSYPHTFLHDGVELYPCDGKGWSGFPRPDNQAVLSQGCWWGVTPAGSTRESSFDGSRITTRLETR